MFLENDILPAVKCPRVGRVDNADRDVQCYKYNCNITYICHADTDYAYGDLTRRCTAQGVWSGIPPVCNGIYNYI